jgi:hypothetical protein
MTWDFYNASRFFEIWRNKGETETLFASDDLAFRNVLRCAIKVQNSEGSFEGLNEHASVETILFLQQIEARMKDKTSRIYLSSEWTPEYRSRRIGELESLLGL